MAACVSGCGMCTECRAACSVQRTAHAARWAKYVQRNNLARSRNHCCNWKTKMHSLCTVEIHVTVNNIKVQGVAQKCFCGEFIVIGSNKPCLGLHVKPPPPLIILRHFNQIWNLSADFHRSPRYQTSLKSVQWKLRWYIRTEGHDKANRRYSQVCECAWKGKLSFGGKTRSKETDWNLGLVTWIIIRWIL